MTKNWLHHDDVPVINLKMELPSLEKTTEERQSDDEDDNKEQKELDINGELGDISSGESCEWLESEDDELIVIETGDGAPLVGTIETAESYYVVNPNQHSFSGLSPSGISLCHVYTM